MVKEYSGKCKEAYIILYHAGLHSAPIIETQQLWWLDKKGTDCARQEQVGVIQPGSGRVAHESQEGARARRSALL